VKESGQKQKLISHLNRTTVIFAVIWTAIIFLGLGWHAFEGYQHALESAHIQALHSFEKDLVYRRWIASHGGVYVPVTEETPPNPYLSNIKNRDITTSDNTKLTLINPAYMTRQVLALGLQQYGHQGHITSLNPIRPQNAPDAWEAKALRLFEQGETEVSELKKIGDNEYLRVMRPMTVEAGCLKCHAAQGYKTGNIRGGVSISVPMKELWHLLYKHLISFSISYALIWLIGLGGISFSLRRTKQRVREQEQMEKEKENLQIQLLHAQKMESIGHLAAGIAHEINTPTQFIATNIDFMKEATEDISSLIKQIQLIAANAPPDVRTKILAALEVADWEYLAEEFPQAIRQSQEGVKRVTTIVQAMKEFSHPSGKGKKPYNLNQLINTTVIVSRNEWKYVAEMVLDLAPELPDVPLLVDEMGQVFLNIIVNAAHAIDTRFTYTSSDKQGTIKISSRQDGEWVEVRISDNGTGMSDSIKKHIFTPFFTTKEVGKGTGQGLSIAYSVITDKHHGSLSCESEVGVGTSFIIRLPIND
jgi:two-component system NtrC family sensor kinase